MELNTILQGDSASVATELEPESINQIIGSPPYFGKVRKYGLGKDELGQEKNLSDYIQKLVSIYHNLRPALKQNGSIWIVIGDKWKNGIQLRVPNKLVDALELDGWYFVEEIIWQKNNLMPSPYKNRFVVDYEKVLFFAKSKQHHYFEPQYEPYSEESLSEIDTTYEGKDVKDYDSANAPHPGSVKSNTLKSMTTTKMPPIGGVKKAGGDNATYSGNTPEFNLGRGRLMRSVWNINTQQYHGAHFAVYPIPLAERMILSGCPFKYCVKCNKGLVPVYTQWSIATRKGKNRKVNTKSGTDSDPNKNLHNSDVSTKRIKQIRKLAGYERKCKCQDELTYGVVLDPFMGTGSSAIAALQNGRKYLGIEMKPDYIRQAYDRIKEEKYSKFYYDFNTDSYQSRLELFTGLLE